MAENTKDLRITTISLDEYDRLKSEISVLKEKAGAQTQTIHQLQDEISKSEKEQPKIRVTHYTERYNDWDDKVYFDENKVEFMNMSEVVSLANKQAETKVNSKLKKLEETVDYYERIEKLLKKENLNLEDELREQKNTFKKERSKITSEYDELLNSNESEYEKNINKLVKASKQDNESYNETIKELKEEIQKVKDSKTDEEVEKKRNEEIKTLKGRIADLEKILNDLKNTSFFKRIGKLRNITLEQNKAAQELKEREWNADKIGTTWVKENGKTRKYNYFDDVYTNMKKMYNGVYDWAFSWVQF